MDVKVFVIIVTYNAMKWVDRCFGSLRNSEIPCVPVVVDNMSKDETVNYLREHYPEVHIIVNNKNRGFGQANNQGIEWAYRQGGTNFFLLNQDAWVHPDTLGKLVDIQNQHDIALVSPIHLNGPGDKMDWGYFTKIIVDETHLDYLSDLELGKTKPFYPVFKINAAAWMLSRRCVEQIGGFDPIYFHYGEDGNYCQRIKYHKEQVVFVPGAYMHHDRIINGDMKVYKKNEVVMVLLYLYTDVNRRPFGNMFGQIKLHLWLMKRALIALVKFRFVDFWNIIQGYLSFFGKIPQMHKSMSNNKKRQPSWLDLNN